MPKHKVYLDYAATTPVDPRALKAMEPYFSARFGNPSSLHSFGQEAIRALDLARETAAKAIGADFREIIFLSSATEANNLALRGLASAELRRRNADVRGTNFSISERLPQVASRGETNVVPRPRFIISATEHESILDTAKDLEQEGIEVIYLPVDKRGVVDLERLKKSLNENTVLVSIMYGNNVVGTIQPITEIGNIIRDFRNSKSEARNPKQIQNSKTQKVSDFGFRISDLPTALPLVHTDAVQAFQYLDCDVNTLGVDLMTISSHKIYGPKGSALLYCKIARLQDCKITPSQKSCNHAICNYAINPIATGGGQEFSLRSGTENVPAIVGFAESLKMAVKNRKTTYKKTLELKKYFWRKLKKSVPKVTSIPENTIDDNNFLPHILNISFFGEDAGKLVLRLDAAGIAAGAGSACSIRSSTPSYVLKELGLSESQAKSNIRFSIGKETTRKDIDFSVKTIKNIIHDRHNKK